MTARQIAAALSLETIEMCAISLPHALLAVRVITEDEELDDQEQMDLAAELQVVCAPTVH